MQKTVKSRNHGLVLFNPEWTWEQWHMKGYSTFPKASGLLEPHHQIVYCHIQDTCWVGSYPSAEVLSVYSTAPADWASKNLNSLLKKHSFSS